MKKQTKQRTKVVKRNQQAGAAKRAKAMLETAAPKRAKKSVVPMVTDATVPAETARPAETTKVAPPHAAVPKETKKAIVLGLLTRDGGATLQELQDATGWQAHSVRGFISGTLRKAMHLTIERAKREDGTPSYRLNEAMTSTA